MKYSMCVWLLLFVYTACSTEISDAILKTVERRAGVCAVIGEGEALAVSLAEQTQFTVYARTLTAYNNEIAQRVKQNEAIAHRMHFADGKLNQIPFADQYLDILVINTSVGISEEECLRAVSPNGYLFIIENGKIVTEKRKPFPEEMDNWEHWFHGPDNNSYSSDKALKWPYLSQWMAPPYAGPTPSIQLVSDGISFNLTGPGAHRDSRRSSIEKEIYADTIVARSVFNGEELWKYPLPKGYFVIRSCAVATKNILYVSMGENVTCLNTKTGEKIKEISLDGVQGDLKWIVIEDDVLYVMAGEKDPLAHIVSYRYTQGHTHDVGKPLLGYGSRVAAYDLKSDAVLWTYDNKDLIDSRLIGFSNGKIACKSATKLVCLNGKNGQVLWSVDDADVMKNLTRKYKKKADPNSLGSKSVGLLCTPQAIYISPKLADIIYAFDAETGKVLWKQKAKSVSWKLFIDGRVYDSKARTYDALTGVKETDGIQGAGCGPITASPFAFFDRHGINTDRITGQGVRDHSFRSSCYQNSFVANGMQINPRYACGCSYIFRGIIVLASAGDIDLHPEVIEAERLETFSNSVTAFTTDEQDWITYRKDSAHSGFTPVDIAETVEKKWEYQSLASVSTAPIAAGAYTFWADSNGMVYCNKDGQIVWSYITGGKIHASPTIWEGRLYVGSSDGFVYCLEVTSGKQLWKFRAAPHERNIMVFKHLSNTWPVNTGILVKDGIAYFAAGMVDRDGTHVFALDATTGSLKWSNNSSGSVDEKNRKGASAHGYMTIANGYLYLAGGNSVSPACFNLDTGEHLFSGYQSYSAYAPARRGRDLANFGDDFLLGGGILVYSPTWDANPSAGFGRGTNISLIKLGKDGRRLYPEIEIPDSLYLPTWDAENIYIEGRNKKKGLYAYSIKKLKEHASAVITEKQITEWPKKKGPKSYLNATKKMLREMKKGKLYPYLPAQPLWATASLNTLGMISANNVLIVATSITNKDQSKSSFLTARDKTNGEEKWSIKLPSQLIYNSLCINRNGDIIAATVDGKILCYGKK